MVVMVVEGVSDNGSGGWGDNGGGGGDNCDGGGVGSGDSAKVVVATTVAVLKGVSDNGSSGGGEDPPWWPYHSSLELLAIFHWLILLWDNGFWRGGVPNMDALTLV